MPTLITNGFITAPMVAQVDLVVHLTMLQALIVGQNPGALITNLHFLLSNYYWLTTKEWKKKWLIHTGKFNLRL